MGLNRRIPQPSAKPIQREDIMRHTFALAIAIMAAAAPGAAASSDYLLTLPPGKGEMASGGQPVEVQVQSFSWGPRQTTSIDAHLDPGGHGMLGASDRAAGVGTDAGSGFSGRGLDIAAVDGAPPSSRAGTLILQGSLRGCTVGKRYAGAQFAAANKRYELKDVVISNCAANGVSLDYSRVTVRGWDPSGH
jgi:hypothetical protein